MMAGLIAIVWITASGLLAYGVGIWAALNLREVLPSLRSTPLILVWFAISMILHLALMAGSRPILQRWVVVRRREDGRLVVLLRSEVERSG